MEFLIYGIEMPLVKILGDAELRGLVIDQEKWIEIIKEKEQEEKDLKAKLDEILRNSTIYDDLLKSSRRPLRKKSLGLWWNKLNINYNSSEQIKSIFRIFGESIPRGTRKNSDGEFEETETVGVKNIQLYLKQKPDTILKDFLETFIKYKKVQKHLSSFGYNYLNMISPITGRLHTVYKQCFTDTGRLSCGDTKNASKPNLQQIPKLKKLRQCFGYLKGYKILTIDLTGAELVILGSKAQDFKLIELNNGDMHSYLAQKSWRKILKDDTYIISQEINTDKRTEFKNVNYGILYGAGVRKIAETLNVSLDHAQLVMDTLNDELPDTFRYMDTASAFALANGYIEFNSRTHSRRWFVERGRSSVGQVKRAAINAPIQGTQADMIKEAMVEINKYLIKNNIDGHLLMQVHDELVFAFRDRDEFPEEIKKIMLDTANKYLVGVEMKASYHVEDTWTK
jgi:DNA polymerase-1